MGSESFATMHTVAFQGLAATPIEIQVHIARGMPGLTLVGLADKAVGESRERVRAAFSTLGLILPSRRITINLAPASVRKEGTHYDLPIACGLLSAMAVLPGSEMQECLALGELALNGLLAPIPGVLPAAISALSQEKRLICPAACGHEAVWAGDGLDVLAPTDLLALINHFKGDQILARPEARVAAEDNLPPLPALSDIRGQEVAKRALAIAAAGGHNMLMIGPPGAGKSMLARRIAALLPPLDAEESLEVSMIQSITGHLYKSGLVRRRPFRDPHHTASTPAMVGGGSRLRPGEVSLAHHGVLFLDELPEFSRTTLEALRQPLENGEVMIARAESHVSYPARFQLVAAMNPCRCGWLGNRERACKRAPLCGREYQARISGPLLDRIDISIEVPDVRPTDLLQPAPDPVEESGLRDWIQSLHHRQKDRNRKVGAKARMLGGGVSGRAQPMLNAHMEGNLLLELAKLDEDGRQMIRLASEKMNLSARGFHRVLRVSRTIADMDDKERVSRVHIAEALSYRWIDHAENTV